MDFTTASPLPLTHTTHTNSINRIQLCSKRVQRGDDGHGEEVKRNQIATPANSAKPKNQGLSMHPIATTTTTTTSSSDQYPYIHTNTYTRTHNPTNTHTQTNTRAYVPCGRRGCPSLPVQRQAWLNGGLITSDAAGSLLHHTRPYIYHLCPSSPFPNEYNCVQLEESFQENEQQQELEDRHFL